MSDIVAIKRDFLEKVEEGYQSEYEARFFLILDEKFNYSRLDYLQGKSLPSEELDTLRADLGELLSGRPVQYLIGQVNFAGLRLKVDERALIPRPETEELVEIVRKALHRGAKCIDLASGSGCIALALAQDGHEVYALEKNREALSLAADNQSLTKLKLQFIEDDILHPQKAWPKGLDLVISNPPYVRQLEKADMSREVYDYEPEMALFVADHDPLVFYKAICDYAHQALNESGLLAFEINRYLVKEMEVLLEQYFHSVEIKEDQFGLARFALATKKRPTVKAGL